MQRLDGNKAAVKQTFDAGAFQSSNTQNAILKVPQGTYTINFFYNDASGTRVYSECASVHTKTYSIHTALFQTQIPICPLGDSNSIGDVPVSQISNVTITPQTGAVSSIDNPQGGSSTLPVNIGPGGYPYCTNGSDTGSGYGWDTSVTDPQGSHSCLVPSSVGTISNTTGRLEGSLPPLNAGGSGNVAFKIADYGAALQTNKQAIAAAADAAGATAQEKALIIAIAMQETTLMNANQRDTHKDGTSSSNCSAMNLNIYMLQQLGYNQNDGGASLNKPENLPQAVGYLLQGMHTWGIEKTLNYQRGGSTAFQDGVSYGAGAYRNAITTIYNQIAADRNLEADGRRVEINLPGV